MLTTGRRTRIAPQTHDASYPRLTIGAVRGHVRHALVLRVDAGLLEKLGDLLRGQFRVREVGRVLRAFAILSMAVVALICLETFFPLRDEGSLLAACRGAVGWCGSAA